MGGPAGLRILRILAVLVLLAGVGIFAYGLFLTVTAGCVQYVPGQTVCQGTDTSVGMEFGGVALFLLGLFSTLGLSALARRRTAPRPATHHRSMDATMDATMDAGEESDEPALELEASAGTIAAAVGVADHTRHGSAAELLASGQRMTAVVREFAATGKTVGDINPALPDPGDPMYVFKCEMPVAGSSPIEATYVHRVPVAKVGQVAIGERLSVAVNPANPTREVAIDCAASPLLPGG